MAEIFIVIPEKERLSRLFDEIAKGHEYARENFFPRILKYAGVSTSPEGLGAILKEELEAYVIDHNLPVDMEEGIYSFAKTELINILVDSGAIREAVRKRISDILKV